MAVGFTDITSDGAGGMPGTPEFVIGITAIGTAVLIDATTDATTDAMMSDAMIVGIAIATKSDNA